MIIEYNAFSLKIGLSSSSILEKYNSEKNLAYVAKDKLIPYLTSVGFDEKNISIEQVTDDIKVLGTILSVSIDGVKEFPQNELFRQDSKIIIYISSSNRLNLKDLVLDAVKDDKGNIGWKNVSYEYLKDMLERNGFKNITYNTIQERSMDRVNKIYSLTINGIIYDGGECYIQKDAPIIITYIKYVS